MTMALRDSLTMLRRALKHMQRFPLMTVSGLMVPMTFLLLFVYVFGGSMEAGLPGGAKYVDYLVPGIIIMSVAAGAGQIAVGVSSDMSQGIIARLRTMAIARGAVLNGHAIGNVIKTVVSVALVIGIALLIGFRPSANPVEWLAATGAVALMAFTVSWTSVPMGLVSKTPAGANSLSLIVQFLPFISSAFARTDSMPAGVRWFSENQPYTPFIETIRGLLMGTPIGSNGVKTVAWCVVLTVAGYLWARTVFNRDPVVA